MSDLEMSFFNDEESRKGQTTVPPTNPRIYEIETGLVRFPE